VSCPVSQRKEEEEKNGVLAQPIDYAADKGGRSEEGDEQISTFVCLVPENENIYM